jgi:hypothetical protein
MNIVKMKTLCTRCLDPLEVEWSEEMNWGGETVTAQQYMANALNSESIQICCDTCLDEMPDFDFNDSSLVVEYL